MKPLITLFVPCYNQESYIREAIRGALAQTYSPLEIIFSDDCSEDNTAAIIKEMIVNYQGPHIVRVNLNPQNYGIGKHVNKAFEISNGELIVFAAGDDISLVKRVSLLADTWLKSNKKYSAIYSGAKLIDSAGNSCGTLKTAISNMQPTTKNLITYARNNKPVLLVGACSAYAADINKRFGPLQAGVNVEDVPLTIRASVLGGVKYIPDELVLYRRGVSVWIPRKLKNESFERYRTRLNYRVGMNYLVAKQILLDMEKIGAEHDIKQAALQRYIATQFVYDCFLKEKFLFSAYIKMTMSSAFLGHTLFPALITANPKIHLMIYKIHRTIQRLFYD